MLLVKHTRILVLGPTVLAFPRTRICEVDGGDDCVVQEKKGSDYDERVSAEPREERSPAFVEGHAEPNTIIAALSAIAKQTLLRIFAIFLHVFDGRETHLMRSSEFSKLEG